MTGQRFARLTFVSFSHIDRHGAVWNCVCDCGETITTRRTLIVQGLTKSCGCLKKEHDAAMRTQAGKSHGREYAAWRHMMDRCYKTHTTHYRHYGGRNISVAKQWHDFLVFLADMGICPEGYEIERIDNDGHYCPENCRWATRKEQMNNTRFNRVLCVDGSEMTMTQWSGIHGIKVGTIWRRLQLGWSASDAVQRPVES